MRILGVLVTIILSSSAVSAFHHPPIHVNGDPAHGLLEGWGGAGTEDDPWIILGRHIETDGPGIWLQNITGHIVIRDTYSHGTPGVLLDNVANVSFERSPLQGNPAVRAKGAGLFFHGTSMLHGEECLQVSGGRLEGRLFARCDLMTIEGAQVQGVAWNYAGSTVLREATLSNAALRGNGIVLAQSHGSASELYSLDAKECIRLDQSVLRIRAVGAGNCEVLFSGSDSQASVELLGYQNVTELSTCDCELTLPPHVSVETADHEAATTLGIVAILGATLLAHRRRIRLSHPQ